MDFWITLWLGLLWMSCGAFLAVTVYILFAAAKRFMN